MEVCLQKKLWRTTRLLSMTVRNDFQFVRRFSVTARSTQSFEVSHSENLNQRSLVRINPRNGWQSARRAVHTLRKMFVEDDSHQACEKALD